LSSARPRLPIIPTITAIYAHAVLQGRQHRDRGAGRSQNGGPASALVEGGFPYLVAEIAGVPAAFAYAGPYRLRPAYRFSVEDSIYVAVERHRSGIGRMLLSA